jgi:hypothetical protein
MERGGSDEADMERWHNHDSRGLHCGDPVGVTQGWGWPMLGSYRAGVGVLLVVGYAMCLIGLRGSEIGSAKDLVDGPFMLWALVLGAVALVLVLIGLIVSTAPVFVALAIDLMALWVVATARHAVEDSEKGRSHLVET